MSGTWTKLHGSNAQVHHLPGRAQEQHGPSVPIGDAAFIAAHGAITVDRPSMPAARLSLMADDQLITKVQLQRTQIDVDRELLRDEDLLNEEHLRRMDQVLLRRNLDHARMFSRKLSLELQQYVHLYTPEANELRRRIEKYLVMERMIEREMARRHTY